VGNETSVGAGGEKEIVFQHNLFLGTGKHSGGAAKTLEGHRCLGAELWIQIKVRKDRIYREKRKCEYHSSGFQEESRGGLNSKENLTYSSKKRTEDELRQV